jgi:protein TonB
MLKMDEPTQSNAAQTPPTPPVEAPRRAWDEFDVEDAPGFLQRHRIVAGSFAAAGVAVLAFFWNDLFPKKTASPTRRENIVVVTVPPPPPPPPPVVPPPPPPPMEQKMIEQAPIENEPKPEAKADEPPPADLATGIKGDGPPDGFGLSGRGGSGGSGGAGSGSAQARSRWGWYAGQVQSRISQAVREHRTTRAANLRAEVKVWADATGRITRANLVTSTGDAALDAALRDEVLAGLQLSEPPPQGMPMPITLRVTARRPN